MLQWDYGHGVHEDWKEPCALSKNARDAGLCKPTRLRIRRYRECSYCREKRKERERKEREEARQRFKEREEARQRFKERVSGLVHPHRPSQVDRVPSRLRLDHLYTDCCCRPTPKMTASPSLSSRSAGDGRTR